MFSQYPVYYGQEGNVYLRPVMAFPDLFYMLRALRFKKLMQGTETRHLWEAIAWQTFKVLSFALC